MSDKTLDYPIKHIPLTNIPSIVYTQQQQQQSRDNDSETRQPPHKPLSVSVTHDVSTLSSFDKFMKTDSSIVLAKNSTEQGSKDMPPSTESGNNILKTILDSYAKKNSNKTGNTSDNENKPDNEKGTTAKKENDDSTLDQSDKSKKPVVKDTDDYIFHVYVGSLSVIGLFILFRILQKG
jgi:hypothetical protein